VANSNANVSDAIDNSSERYKKGLELFCGSNSETGFKSKLASESKAGQLTG